MVMIMNLAQLKQKASGLPLLPGVYIMKDASDKVIYVGKAKKLKNRVSQYFQDTASHSGKTRLMVSKIDHFDVIVCSSEFEALVLECSQIKQYKPKYNILLKDDKGFPYIRIDRKETYPRITVVSKIAHDGAEYYGPFGSRSSTKNLVETIKKTLLLPGCAKIFPRDIGKDRPCLNFHMKRCLGWCQMEDGQQEYLERIDQARQLLSGRYKDVYASIKQKMLAASESLNFEQAAALRDQLLAVESLGTKQLVATDQFTDTDAVGYAEAANKACFAVLHFSRGKLIDKEYEIIDLPDDGVEAVSAFVKQFYLNRGFAPKMVLLPVKMKDGSLFSQMLEQETGRKTKFLVPQRGDKMQIVCLAETNAKEEVEQRVDSNARANRTLELLGKMLNMPAPKRIESFDISNISGTDTVASMVVFMDGKPRKGEYKRFKINDLDRQDDYASMEQVLRRRFNRFLESDEGFSEKPDLLLIDGGVTHAKIAQKVLTELQIQIPVFGMVKDDRHRTRALVTAEGNEIRIDAKQAVFSFIGNIQEETHRFAIDFHKKLRSKRLRYSALDQIEGVGPKRKQDLLKMFKSLSAISEASVTELERILPKQVAENVVRYFEQQKKGE